MVLGDRAMKGIRPLGIIAALAALLLANACGEGEVTETLLPLPEAASVERILLSTPTSKSPPITDPQVISEVLRRLDSLRVDWELVTDPSMIPTESLAHTAQFNGPEHKVLLLLWIGDTWIGANDMQGGTSLRQSLTGRQREELVLRFGRQ